MNARQVAATVQEVFNASISSAVLMVGSAGMQLQQQCRDAIAQRTRAQASGDTRVEPEDGAAATASAPFDADLMWLPSASAHPTTMSGRRSAGTPASTPVFTGSSATGNVGGAADSEPACEGTQPEDPTDTGSSLSSTMCVLGQAIHVEWRHVSGSDSTNATNSTSALGQADGDSELDDQAVQVVVSSWIRLLLSAAVCVLVVEATHYGSIACCKTADAPKSGMQDCQCDCVMMTR
jgi:hypothetical protein